MQPSPPNSPRSVKLDIWKIPLSEWSPSCHPLVDQVSQEVDDYFLSRWNWPDEKSKRTFVAAGFSRVTCLYFPLARNDRISLACKLLTVLFLVDGMLAYQVKMISTELTELTVADELEDMSLQQGKAYNDSLIAASKGEILLDCRYSV
jgi:aristolochene synthase